MISQQRPSLIAGRTQVRVVVATVKVLAALVSCATSAGTGQLRGSVQLMMQDYVSTCFLESTFTLSVPGYNLSMLACSQELLLPQKCSSLRWALLESQKLHLRQPPQSRVCALTGLQSVHLRPDQAPVRSCGASAPCAALARPLDGSLRCPPEHPSASHASPWPASAAAPDSLSGLASLRPPPRTTLQTAAPWRCR